MIGRLIRDPSTKRPFRDATTKRPIRTTADSDCCCGTGGCGGSVSCVSITFGAFNWSSTGDCFTGGVALDGAYRLLPQDEHGHAAPFKFVGCFPGAAITCGTPGDGACDGGEVATLDQLFIVALCPGFANAGGKWLVFVGVGSPFTDNPNDNAFNCCSDYLLANVPLAPGVPYTISEAGNPTVSGSITLNLTCEGVDPSDCQDCTAPPPPPTPSCELSYLQTLPTTYNLAISGFAVLTPDCASVLNGNHLITFSETLPPNGDFSVPSWSRVEAPLGGDCPDYTRWALSCAGIDEGSGLPIWEVYTHVVFSTSPSCVTKFRGVGATPADATYSIYDDPCGIWTAGSVVVS